MEHDAENASLIELSWVWKAKPACSYLAHFQIPKATQVRVAKIKYRTDWTRRASGLMELAGDTCNADGEAGNGCSVMVFEKGDEAWG